LEDGWRINATFCRHVAGAARTLKNNKSEIMARVWQNAKDLSDTYGIAAVLVVVGLFVAYQSSILRHHEKLFWQPVRTAEHIRTLGRNMLRYWVATASRWN